MSIGENEKFVEEFLGAMVQEIEKNPEDLQKNVDSRMEQVQFLEKFEKLVPEITGALAAGSRYEVRGKTYIIMHHVEKMPGYFVAVEEPKGDSGEPTVSPLVSLFDPETVERLKEVKKNPIAWIMKFMGHPVMKELMGEMISLLMKIEEEGGETEEFLKMTSKYFGSF